MGLIFLTESTPAMKTIAVTVTTKIKTNEQNPISIKKNAFMHLILPLIFKKSAVTIIYTEAVMGSKLTPACMICTKIMC